MLRAATPGTLLVLAGTVLLAIATVSSPIWNSVYFLSADFSGSGGGGSVEVSGRVLFGTFGYCAEDGSICSDTQLGYQFDTNSIFGVPDDIIDLPQGVIQGLTYVLVLHPIGAGIGLISLILGLVAHFKEMSVVCGLAASWVAGLASFICVIAFGFDIALFTIAKNRINDAASDSGDITVDTAAEYGNAIWITLAGFLCFAFSGCCFRFGRRVVRERMADRAAANAFKPNVDPEYAAQARENARKEELMKTGYGQPTEERGLPYFTSHNRTASDVENGTEAVPLTQWDENGYGGGHRDPYANATSTTGGYEREQVPGVGTGYGRRDYIPPQEEDNNYAYGNGAAAYYDQPSSPTHSHAQQSSSHGQNLGPAVQRRLYAGRNNSVDQTPARQRSPFDQPMTSPTSNPSYAQGIPYAAQPYSDPYGEQSFASPKPSQPQGSQYQDAYGAPAGAAADQSADSSQDFNTYPPNEMQQQEPMMSGYDYHQPEPAATSSSGYAYGGTGGFYNTDHHASGSYAPPSYRSNMASEAAQGYGGRVQGPLANQDHKTMQYW